jgi:hypothetical protein
MTAQIATAPRAVNASVPFEQLDAAIGDVLDAANTAVDLLLELGFTQTCEQLEEVIYTLRQLRRRNGRSSKKRLSTAIIAAQG